MNLAFTPAFRRQYAKAPPNVQRAFDRRVAFLAQDLRHPSLHAKKFPERGEDIWQARVNDDWRFFFSIEVDTYLIQAIERHPK